MKHRNFLEFIEQTDDGEVVVIERFELRIAKDSDPLWRTTLTPGGRPYVAFNTGAGEVKRFFGPGLRWRLAIDAR